MEHAEALMPYVASFGYLAVFLAIAIESTGIPFPGETALIVASAYAAATGELQIPFVILASAAGAVVGDNFGYWLGREGGHRLLVKYGKYVRVDESKLLIGEYFFWKHGRKVVFFGRFVAILRTWAAFLAGVNVMPWRTFTFYNMAGGVIWATIFGVGGFTVGTSFHTIKPPAWILIGGWVVGAVGFGLIAKRAEKKLLADIEKSGFQASLVRSQKAAEEKAAHAHEVQVPVPHMSRLHLLHVEPIYVLMAACLLIGLVRVWLIDGDPSTVTGDPSVGGWSWAFDAAFSGRLVALVVAAIVAIGVVAASRLRRRRMTGAAA